MKELPTPQDAANLLFHLRHHQNSRQTRQTPPQLETQMALLRTWQSERLARTHADLLDSRRYGPACRFFLSDIYAPRDFTQRDHDIERMYHFMLKFLPNRILRPLTLAIELNTLTDELDNALLVALVDDLNVSDTLTGELYAAGYRICDNYNQRERQIDLLVEIGRGLGLLVRLPLVSISLRLARGPAHQAGWFELQDFLERGLAAFGKMRGTKKFLRLIEQREKQILDQIFAAKPDPFDLE